MSGKLNGHKHPALSPLAAAMLQARDLAPKPTDEVEAEVKVDWKPGGVRLSFGKKLSWLGFTPEGARELAQALNDFADKADESVPTESAILVPQ